MMTRTNYRLGCVGDTLPWSSLLSFIRHLPADSATFMSQNQETALWSSPMKQAAILADLVDMVNMMRWEFACSHVPKGERLPNRPLRYPRPGARSEEDEHVPFDRDEFKAFYFDD